MARWADEDDLVAKERLEGNRPLPRCRSDHAELDLAPRDGVDHVLGVEDGERNRQLGVTPLELAEENGEDGAPRPCRSPDLEPPAEGGLNRQVVQYGSSTTWIGRLSR